MLARAAMGAAGEGSLLSPPARYEKENCGPHVETRLALPCSGVTISSTTLRTGAPGALQIYRSSVRRSMRVCASRFRALYARRRQRCVPGLGAQPASDGVPRLHNH
jgi:hypothetical protein